MADKTHSRYKSPVLIAPGSFKGTFSAHEVASAIAEGLGDRVSATSESGMTTEIPIDVCPAADGGDGTLGCLQVALGGELLQANVHDPLGRMIEAQFALLDDKRTAVVEAACAGGLALLKESEFSPVEASTYGVGELICAATAEGAQKVLVGVGGLASTDGGEGALEAIRENGGLHGAKLTLLCDVRTPWEAAAATFAPQKGASAQSVRTLEERMDKLAQDLPKDPRGVKMTGCGGGLSGGLWAAQNARLESGANWILDALNFDRRMRAACAVITGEGRLDDQTLQGKLVGELATRARQAGVPVYAIVGEDRLRQFEKRILDFQQVYVGTTRKEIIAAAQKIGSQLSS